MVALPYTLDRRVLIQRPASGKDAAGQPSTGWVNAFDTPDGKLWANVRKLGGLETIKAGAVAAKVTASIRLRYRTGLDASMRVIDGADVFLVRAVLDDSSRRWVDLAVESIA